MTSKDNSALIDHGVELEDPESIGLDSGQREAIWSAVEKWYDTGTQPFISVCIRNKGETLLHRSIGHSHGHWTRSGMSEDSIVGSVKTPVCVFSASKALTGMLMHSLAEDGLIDLDQRVSHYLPKFGQRGKKSITISQVLSHQGGFPQLPTDMPVETLFDFDTCVEEICKVKVGNRWLRGSAYHAISGGYILAAVANETSGLNLNQLLRKRIAGPLGLSSLRYGATKKNQQKVATNYDTGGPVPFPLSTLVKKALGAPWSTVVEISNQAEFLDTIVPAGNAVGTCEDWCSFMETLRCGGELDGTRVFKKQTIKRAIKPAASTWSDAILRIPMRYSEGLMLGNSPLGLFGPNSRKSFGHLGFINIFCWADPVRETSVALLSTGKALLGFHLTELLHVMSAINKNTRS